MAESGKKLFDNLNVENAKWHYHRVFYLPQKSTKILTDELRESIIYEDEILKGNFYVTSLDPDYHLGQGFMLKTEPFFDHFLNWVESDILDSRR